MHHDPSTGFVVAVLDEHNAAVLQYDIPAASIDDNGREFIGRHFRCAMILDSRYE